MVLDPYQLMAIGIGDQGEEQAFLRTKTSAKFNIDMTKPIVAQVRIVTSEWIT